MLSRRTAVFLLTIAALSSCDSQNPLSTDGRPFLERRAAFHTTLKAPGPSPQKWQVAHLPSGLKPVVYQSDPGALKAWLFVPSGSAVKRPALAYFHGGYAFGVSDFEDVRPFADAGFVVMCPALRGENGNPGAFEHTLGEIDDAVAAIRWLADQESVDARRIYAFGHSNGGIVSALLSLMDNVPIQHSGSSGGLYGTDVFTVMSRRMPARVPFISDDPQESQLRVLVGNVRWMKRPHYAFVGTSDRLMKVNEGRQEAREARAPLDVIEVEGDHGTSLKTAVLRYLAIAEKDK